MDHSESEGDTKERSIRERPMRKDSSTNVAPSPLTLELRPVAPFRLDLTAWALRRRHENLIDRWDGETYRRVLLVSGHPAEIHVSQHGSEQSPLLEVNLSGVGCVPHARDEVAGLLTRMLGLQADLKPFYRLVARDRKLACLAEKYRGLKPVRFPTVFEALTNAIACQQFTITAGLQLLNRLARLGSIVIDTATGPAFGFPEPSDFLRIRPQTFRRLGFSRQKTRAFRDLSAGIQSGRTDLRRLMNLDNQAAKEYLQTLTGVGRWTAEYVLLRGLGRLDVFPGDDVGARNGLTKWLQRRKPMDYASVGRALAPWQPYTGFIYFHMLLESLDASGRLRPTEGAVPPASPKHADLG